MKAKGKRNEPTVGRRRRYGAHNLPCPPTSWGRLLAIQIPKPKTLEDLKGMMKTYLPGWTLHRFAQGGFLVRSLQSDPWAVVKTLEELLTRLYCAMKEGVMDRLVARVEKEVGKNPAHQTWKQQRDREQEERERRCREAAEERRKAGQEKRRRNHEEQKRQQARFWERTCVTPWQLLGVAAHAPVAAINTAYHRLAKECHPDWCSQHGLDVETATGAFQVLATAREEALALLSA